MLLLSILLTRAVHGASTRPMTWAAVSPKPNRSAAKALQARARAALSVLIALLMVVLELREHERRIHPRKTLSAAAEKLAAAGQTGGLAPDDFKGKYIGQFYAASSPG
jgi:hypothetical protein